MRSLTVLALAGWLMAQSAAAVDTRDTRMLHEPAVSGDRIAFIYAEDLWVADLDGSHARQLTTHDGIESHPRFSPAGDLLAFSAEYDGNTDIFVIPVEGGVPRRLTWHPAADLVQDFSADGTEILFTSPRNTYAVRLQQLYTVPVRGGFPTQVPLPHADAGVFSPDDSKIAYRPHWEAFNEWKHYRGGTASRIVIFDRADLSVEAVPWPRGRANDTDAMWVGPLIYFRSDRHGEFNLYSYDPAKRKIRQLTEHDDFPIVSASAGGGRIIYEQAGYLHLYDIATGRNRRLRVAVAADLIETRPRYVAAGEQIRHAAISPSGARAVFEARGEIVTVPASKGSPRLLSRSPGANDRSPAWSPDGRLIAWFTDASGEYQLRIVAQDGSGEILDLPLAGAGFYENLAWSPDSLKVAYTDNSHSLYWLDIDSGRAYRVGGDRLYSPQATLSFSWSPDSRWIAYNRNTRTYMNRVWIHSLEDGVSRPITGGLSDSLEPVWDASGRYLYLLASTDAGPIEQWFAQSNADKLMTRSIYLVVLRSGEPSPLAPESDEEDWNDAVSDDSDMAPDDELFGGSDDAGPVGGDEAATDREDDVPAVEIDFEAIDQRIVALPLPAAGYHDLQAGAAGQIFYLTAPAGQNPFADEAGHALNLFDLESRQESPLIDAVAEYQLTPSGEKLLYRGDGDWFIGVTDPLAEEDEALDTAAISVRIEPRAEWEQIFHEAWRINRDYFYDPNMHGADWPALRDLYAQFLPDLAVRSDLNRVIQWMSSELGVGHHRVGGGDRARQPQEIPGGLLGVDFEIEDSRYRFARVFGGLNWNPDLRAPATEPGIDIAVGEYLLEVEGEGLYAPENVYSRFENTAGRLVEIRVGPNADGTGSRLVRVVPIASELELRRRAWVEGNLRRVQEATEGRVAYVYVPNTAGQGHEYFKRYFFPQTDKEALILDDRHNSGGQIADYYIDLLRRPFRSHWAMRYGDDLDTPMGSIQGPKAMLIDENAASGGDLLPWMFRQAGLGPLVGRRTWGGLVGVLGFPELMDGGFVTAPNVAIWTRDGFIVENEGVPPDIDVELSPAAAAAGYDAQLEKAIEVILDQLEKNPPVHDERPPFPIRGNN